MKVRTKLTIGFTVIVVLLWLVTISAGNNFGSLKSQFAVLDERVMRGTFATHEAEMAASDIYNASMAYIFKDVPDEKETAISGIRHLEQISINYLPPAINTEHARYETAQATVFKINAFLFSIKSIINMKAAGAGPNDMLAYNLAASFPALLDLQQSIEREKTSYTEELVTAKADFNKAYDSGVRSFLLSAIIITLLAIATAISTMMGITKPLHALREGTEMIARGNLSHKVGTKSGDEIGQLGRAFDQMTQKLSRSMTSIDNLNQEIAERKYTESALKESEEKFRNLFERAQDAIILADSQTGLIVDVNNAGADLLGLPREKIIGMHQSKIHPPDKVEKYKKLFKEHIVKGTVLSEEILIQHADGRQIPVEISTSIVNLAGKPVIQGVFHDITERNRMEKSLRESEEKFSKAFHASPDAISIYTLSDGTFLEINESYSRITGFSREETIGRTAEELGVWIKTADSERLQRTLKEQGRIVNEEFEFVNKAGEKYTQLLFIEPIVISGEECWISIMTDITERKRMEQDLANEAIWRRLLVEQSSDGIVILDQDGKVFEANFRFAEMLGYSLEEVMQLHVWDWEFLIVREKVLDMIRTVDETGDHFETQHLRKDGTTLDVEISTNGATIAGQKLIFCVCRDITERKRTEKSLKESEEKFSTAFQAIPESVSISRLKDGIFLDVNDSFCRHNGRTREEVVGRTAEEVGLWAHPGERKQMLQALQERGHFENQEFEFHVKSGEIHTVLLSADIINIGGEPSALVIGNDITERKLMENALRESEEKFSAAFRSSPATIAITTLKNSKYIEVNDSYIHSTGYTSKELIGRSPNDVNIWAKPEDRTKLFKILKEQGRVNNEEFDFRMKSGEIRTWLFSAEQINIAGELCLIGVSIDITEHKLIEEALRSSEEKFSKVFHASPDITAIVRVRDSIFVDVNENFISFNGFPREEVIGHTATELGIWLNIEERDRILKIMQEKGSVRNEEFHLRTKSGKIRIGLFSTEIVKFGGEPYSVAMTVDITERKQAEENLKQAMSDLELSTAQLKATNKELESFSYSVSHDLRSPLRSIDGFSQALLEDYSSKIDKTGQDYLNRLRNASQKMGELIDGLLKLSRLTRIDMHHENVDLSALAEEITARLRETHPNRKAKFVIDSGLSAKGDPQMLRVMLENLLGNAFKFTRKTPHARIEFGSAVNGEKKTYFVKDNGAGFDMSFKDKLFGAFQRLHDSTDFPGTGIGLATVQRIITRHGGSIRAEGTVNKGATFYFTLS